MWIPETTVLADVYFGAGVGTVGTVYFVMFDNTVFLVGFGGAKRGFA
jgi:hypothetical protein